ncbi:MAG: DUF2125 domain-containing protein [Magnetospirillum sp.]|nr:DUF2125 domain-containing protein [Magnetospirillum sp.]
MSIRPRSLLVILAGLILVPAAGYAFYWFHAAGELRKGVDAFAAARRAEGWRVEFAQGRLFGFPGRIGLDLGETRLTSPAGFSWRSNGLSIVVPGLDPLNPRLELGTQHDLAMGESWRGIVTAASTTLLLRVDGDGDLHSFAFDAVSPVLEQPGAAPVLASTLSVTYDWLNPAAPGHETASVRFSLGLRDVDVAALAGLPLGRRFETVQLEGRIMGSIPEIAPLAALAAWSRDGGIVELDRFTVDWPPLALEGDGTLAFDHALQPQIATVARIRGWKEFMARLAQAGLIEPGMASAADFLLAILSRPDEQGRPTLTLALTLQDGYLYAGQARLMQVPPLPITPPNPGAPPS